MSKGKKKIEIPTNDPRSLKNKNEEGEGQTPDTNTRADIAAQRPDEWNSNHGPEQRTKNKS